MGLCLAWFVRGRGGEVARRDGLECSFLNLYFFVDNGFDVGKSFLPEPMSRDKPVNLPVYSLGIVDIVDLEQPGLSVLDVDLN